MTQQTGDEFLSDLEKWLGLRPASRDGQSFWDQLFGEGQGSSDMFFDAEGKDRTALVKALVARIDQLDGKVAGLLERVAVLERIVVTDEAKLAAEIEKLRGGPRP